jgi:hypothetical protein
MKFLKNIALFVTILIISFSACAQPSTEVKTSGIKAEPVAPKTTAKLDTKLPWLQMKIWDYQSKPVSNPPRSVIKTTFEGKTVYYVPAVCCDIPSELYAENGDFLCYPSGGFTGAGDDKCPKFKSEYLDNKTSIVWRDKRKAAVNKRVVPDLP